MDEVSLGIDFGSTGLRAAWAGPQPGVRILPGVPDEWPWTYQERDEAGQRVPVFTSLKSKLGVARYVRVGGENLAPGEVLSRALSAVHRQAAGESAATIGQTVIAVPVSYQSAQRTALRECARAAGLERVRLVSDSMAAVAAHAGTAAAGTFLVYALGYRGFEAGLIRAGRGRLQALGSGHAPGPGGAMIDEQLITAWLRQACPEGAPVAWDGWTWENLRADAQAMRERWADGASAHYPFFLPGGRESGPPPMVVDEPYSEFLRQVVTATVGRAATVLRDASVTEADVDAVLLVGGCTRMWPVRDQASALGRTVITTEASHVVTGAARYARFLDSPDSAAPGGTSAPADPAETTVDGARVVRIASTAQRPGTDLQIEEPVLPGLSRPAENQPVPSPPTDGGRPVSAAADLLAKARALAGTGQYGDAVAVAHRAWDAARPEDADVFEGMIDLHCTAAENTREADYAGCERWLNCALKHGSGSERVRELLTQISYEHARELSDAGQRSLALQVLDDALPVAASHGPSRDLYRRLKRAATGRR
jgi:hypothetical protein